MKPNCDHCGQPRKTTCPSKRCKIIYLLDHRDDIYNAPMSSSERQPGSGSGAGLPDMARHESVQELERALTQLKREQPRWHDHLKAYYSAEWRIHTRYSSKKRKGGKTEQITHRDRVRKHPQWVKLGYVRSGEQRLEELFNGQVFIPEPLYDALHLSSGEIEAKRLRKRATRQAAQRPVAA